MRGLLLAAVLGGALQAQAWRPVEAGLTSELRGLAAPTTGVVWVTGSDGAVRLSEDGGAHWRPCPVAGGEALDYRDVEALDGRTAWILAAGTGELGRIYHTTDGGRSWALQFRNPAGVGFLNALAFWDGQRGLALGDPIQGRFQVLRTEDGGRHWTPTPPAGLPAALPLEGAFAASGSCLRTGAPGEAWFVTGGAATSRLFHTRDGGLTWTATPVPVPAAEASKGLFTVTFLDAVHGIALGGDHQRPDLPTLNAALTEDGGRTWRPAPAQPVGYRSGSSAVPGRPGALVAVGLSGTGFSLDFGRTWTRLDGTPLNTVAFAPDGTGWGVGPKGRLVRLEGALPPAGTPRP